MNECNLCYEDFKQYHTHNDNLTAKQISEIFKQGIDNYPNMPICTDLSKLLSRISQNNLLKMINEADLIKAYNLKQEMIDCLDVEQMNNEYRD